MGRERPPVSFLEECFSADFEAGILTWKKRPIEHFKSKRGCSIWNARYPGLHPTAKNEHGYLMVTLTYGGYEHHMRVHRVLYAMMSGAWPDFDIDHKDGNQSDNRACQLRPATDSQNLSNISVRVDNKLGMKGVHRHYDGRFRAQIKKDGKRHELGCFPTPELAHEAYKRAALQLHGEFAKW